MGSIKHSTVITSYVFQHPESGVKTLQDRIIAGIRDGSFVKRLENGQITGEEEQILLQLLTVYREYINQANRGAPEIFRENLRRCLELLPALQMEETPPDPLAGKIIDPKT